MGCLPVWGTHAPCAAAVAVHEFWMAIEADGQVKWPQHQQEHVRQARVQPEPYAACMTLDHCFSPYWVLIDDAQQEGLGWGQYGGCVGCQSVVPQGQVGTQGPEHLHAKDCLKCIPLMHLCLDAMLFISLYTRPGCSDEANFSYSERSR